MKQTGFAACNPIVCFSYFMGAVLLGVLTMHPIIMLLGLGFSVLTYVFIKGKGFVKKMLAFLPLFVILAMANPLFNTRGDTVLFTYLGERRFTLEALLFGMTLAAMFVSMIIWFMSFHYVMSQDKILYLFGKCIPNIGIIVSMVLGLVPRYLRQIISVSDARRGIGKSKGEQNGGKIKEKYGILQAVTEWSLENGIVTSESMKCRGYGLKGRSTYSIYSIKPRDIALLIWMAFLFTSALVCSIKGGFDADFFPQIIISGTGNIYFIIGICAITLYMIIPILINNMEKIKWCILKSET